MKTRPDLAAWIITGLALVGIVVCALLRVPIPDVLVNLATASLGAAAGVSFAGGTGVSDTLARLVTMLEGRAAAPAPAPAAATADPAATGVFRMATHAPS